MSVSKMAAKLKDEFDRVVSPNVAEEPKPEKKVERKGDDKNQTVIVDSVSGCQVKFAKCCNPLPGDSIIGFITRGFGVSIHKYDCPNATKGLKNPSEKDRWVVASWTRKALDRAVNTDFEATLNIYADYTTTVLADITVALSEMKIKVTSIILKEQSQSEAIILTTVHCNGIDQLKLIMTNLKKLKNIKEVKRGYI